MTSISEACVYPILATFHCILYGCPGSFCMHKAEHLSRAERDDDARRIGGLDRQGRHPVTAMSHQLLLGDRGQSWEGSPGGSFLTDIKRKQANSDGVYSNTRAAPGLADSAAIRALEWTDGSSTARLLMAGSERFEEI